MSALRCNVFTASRKHLFQGLVRIACEHAQTDISHLTSPGYAASRFEYQCNALRASFQAQLPPFCDRG